MSQRLQQLDVLRGVAILLMLLDHALFVFRPSWSPLIRCTLTRAALPLFMLVSGWLWAWRGPSFRRLVWLFPAAGAASLLGYLLCMPFPDILVVYAITMVVSPLVVRWPLVAVCWGFVQALQFPVDWHGYQPGGLVAFLAVGVLWYRSSAGHLPVLSGCLVRPLAFVGRWPLTFYLGHLSLLLLLLW